MFRKAKKQRKRNFSLIELLVVVAIIGILAGIILVVTYQAKQKARVAAGKGMLSSIPGALSVCRMDDGEVLKPVDNGYICNPQTISADRYPSLAGSGWNWCGGGLSSDSGGGSDDSVAIIAVCWPPRCGERSYYAICRMQPMKGSTIKGYGCSFFQWP